MAEQKTKQTSQSAESFINDIENEQVRNDCLALMNRMQKITGYEPKMWGASIVGFGTYHYKYASGHEGDSCLAGFSPRKQNITLYVMPGFDEYEELILQLGKLKTGKGCLYIKRLSDINLAIFDKLVSASVKQLKKTYS
jgi:hypothetical protein